MVNNNEHSPAQAERIRAYVNMHAQTENAGDALVLRELTRLIASRVRTDVYLGNSPETFIRQLAFDETGARAHRGDATVTLIRDILGARLRGWRCYYFLTAGAPHGERSVQQFVLDMIRITWIGILTVFGVRVCQVGVSFENIGPRHARVLRWRSRILHASVPRDRIASDYMRELGIRATGLMPDVALNMFSSEPESFEPGRKAIAFSFRVDKYPEVRDRLRDIVEHVSNSLPADDTVYFVAQVRRDVAFMRELADYASVLIPGRSRFIDAHKDINCAFATYNECRAVLSNRLHALLPSLKQGCSPIALTIPELDPKIVGVFDMIGLRDRVLDIRDVTGPQLAEWMGPIQFDGRKVAQDLNMFFDDLLSPAPL
jgi:hypothetical protein